MANMRYVEVPPDTKGVGTPTYITDEWGGFVGSWDNVDILRLRLARWLFLSGRFDEFGIDVPDERVLAAISEL